jgi:hypothetical protein
MKTSAFLKTIYLGDRACKGVDLDSWSKTVRVRVDCISRIRSASGTWDFYAAEDIKDGALVFGGVDTFVLTNDGRLPNDLINSVEVVEESGETARIRLSIDSVDAGARHHEVTLELRCTTLHLEDPARPGVSIVT